VLLAANRSTSVAIHHRSPTSYSATYYKHCIITTIIFAKDP